MSLVHRTIVGLRRGRGSDRLAEPCAADARNAPVRPPTASACYAPHSALYLRPDGVVQACCATSFEAGTVTGADRQTLRGIWDGARLAQQREELEGHSFELGCQECRFAIDGGGRAASLASTFDGWQDEGPLGYPKLLDLALSNRCNLQCVMCNGDLSSTIRAKREGRSPLPAVYDDRFFDELAEFLPHADRILFKGGEPFLAPENRRVWDLMKELRVTCETSVTTNGTVWNDQVESYLRDLRMGLHVSVDGMTPEVLEPIRVGVRCRDLWERIDRFQEVSEDIGRRLTLNYCVMPSNWHELPAFLVEVERRGVGAASCRWCSPPWSDPPPRSGRTGSGRSCSRSRIASGRRSSSPLR